MLSQKAHHLITGLFFLSASVSFASEGQFSSGKKYYLEGNTTKAIEAVEKISDGKLSQDEFAFKHFVLGEWNYEQGHFDKAFVHLEKSIELKTKQLAYAHYLLGVILKSKREFSKSQAHLSKSIILKPTRNILYLARFEQSEIDINSSKWNSAYGHLSYLERKWRGEEKYPEVLWRLIEVETKRKRKWRACHWARRIYNKYPVHALVHDWGIDLHKNKFAGQRLDCVATPRDIKSRIQRLLWAGESARARQEIDVILSRAQGEAKFDADMILANFLIREGYMEDSLKVLLPYYEKKKKNMEYLMLLAKSASKADEYQTAVGAYYQAHSLSPRSRSGRQALFSAAFLSYQFQDYDGASRKFKQFISKYPNSGLSRDSKWHLAWVRYLKGDYKGASQDFFDILKKRNHRRSPWRQYSLERINYWLAMSYLKMEEHAKAKVIFENLAQDKLISYYSLAAKERIKNIPKALNERDIASIKSEFSKEELDKLGIEADAVADSVDKNDKSEENESEETLAQEGVAEEEEEASDTVADKEESAEKEDVEQVTRFKNPQLAARFQTAQQLIQVGLYDQAKWELYEIERRTKNKAYLKTLMQSYEDIESYNRSTYIGYTYFQSDRKKYGIQGERPVWESSYPKAFEEHVKQFTKQFEVPSEFAWAIMRAESHFKHDVVSPVGAKGLMQIMPHTAEKVSSLIGDKNFVQRDLIKPPVNIKIGTRYLSRLLKKFSSEVALAAAGYNAGPHRVETWLSSFGSLEMDEFVEHIPFIETRDYVKKVIRNYAIYQQLYGKEGAQVAFLSEKIPVTFTSSSHRENWD